MSTNNIEQTNDTVINTEILEELKVGHVVKGIIKGIGKNMIRVHLGSKVCYLPTSEVSWTNKKNSLKDKDEIEAVVIKIQEDGFVMLSVKRLQEDPWKEVLKRFQVGMKVKGKIQLAQPFGLIVDLGNSITALLHKNNVGVDKDINWFDYILIGNILEVEITEIDTNSRKIGLKCDSFFEQYPKRTK